MSVEQIQVPGKADPDRRKRVLFVDDEPLVLAGLRRQLRPMRDLFDHETAGSGEDALAMLAESCFDVVVTDIRMPGMDGVELLERIKADHPGIVRIVLSGYTEAEAVISTLGPSHQYLSKPCDPGTLRRTLQRACALQDVLCSEELASLLSSIETLPSLPTLYHQLFVEIRREDTSATRVGAIMAQDVGMTAKLLQFVNSAFFGLPREVTDPVQAVTLLGLDTVRAVALYVPVFTRLEHRDVPGCSPEQMWMHSLQVATAAKRLTAQMAHPGVSPDEAFLVGFLHDCGRILLASELPDRYREAAALAEAQTQSLVEAERTVFGASHAEAGAYLLGLWGLPHTVVEAVAYHHDPRSCANQSFSLLTAVVAAEAAVTTITSIDPEASDLLSEAPPDREYLARHGLEDPLGRILGGEGLAGLL